MNPGLAPDRQQKDSWGYGPPPAAFPCPRPPDFPAGRQGARGRPQRRRKDDSWEQPTVTPLWKTRTCNFFLVGKCKKGKSCSYAHGEADYRPSPDFERTSICPAQQTTGRCTRPGCRYAHSYDELRVAPGLLKSKMCNFFMHGVCVVGEACRFAHSQEELLEAKAVTDAATTDVRQVRQQNRRDPRQADAPQDRSMAGMTRSSSVGLQPGGWQHPVVSDCAEWEPRLNESPFSQQPASFAISRRHQASMGNALEPMKVVLDDSWDVDVPDVEEDSWEAVAALEPVASAWRAETDGAKEDFAAGSFKRSASAPRLRSAARAPRGPGAPRDARRAVLVDSSVVDLDGLVMKDTDFDLPSVLSKKVPATAFVKVFAGQGGGEPPSDMLLDIENTEAIAQKWCKGCDNFQSAEALVEIRRRSTVASVAGSAAAGTCSRAEGFGPKIRSSGLVVGGPPKGPPCSRAAPPGAEAKVEAKAAAPQADIGKEFMSWCRMGHNVLCDAPTKACALCSHSSPSSGCGGSDRKTPCAACNCGLRVVQHNTFLTVEEDDPHFPIPEMKRSKSF
mmetsp:Transcript_3756/g.5854  ORF Transcript_3756/g.5854 Transcript_3756/m.5854 type:complete len:561 (-) Transcript_3756:315-1997(-)